MARLQAVRSTQMISKITEHSDTGLRSAFPISPLAARIFAVAAAAGTDARIVGGAVRDWLMDQPIGDIDMAIAMPITAAAALLRDAGMKVIETGIIHGTVTVVTGDETIEVTQTRIDVETDGRHAQVAFSDDWAADAARRDLTINAIYLTADGAIDDPLGGQRDLAARRVRFSGIAAERVQEDALRMIRYCRFVAHFVGADRLSEGAIDPDAMAALQAHAGLTRALSGERVAAEFSKICRLPDAATAFAVMQETGVARAALGCDLMPERATHLAPLHARGVGADAATDDWVLWLAAITAPDAQAGLPDRLRLSRKQQHLLSVVARDDDAFDALNGANWQQAAWMLRRNRGVAAATYAVGAARRGYDCDPSRYQMMAAWTPPQCPVTGVDLLSHGVDNGPALGQMLGAIEQRWVQSDFTLDKATLLADL